MCYFIDAMARIFILSPAKTGGERSKLIYNPHAKFDLAQRLRSDDGAPLAEVFSFLSGLYFRGKYTYAKAFARPPRKIPGILVITPNRGLLPAEIPVTIDDLKSFSEVSVDPKDPRYLEPLERDSNALAQVTSRRCDFVFLGSVSSNKYVEILLKFFGKRLLFPPDFLGRGDMSRGGLLLRHAASGEQLDYIPLEGAIRRGKRPPRLEPRRWGYKIDSGQTDLPASEPPSHFKI